MPGIQQGESEATSLSNKLLDNDLRIYKHRRAEIGTNHLSITYYTPNESTNSTKRFCFPPKPVY